MSVVSVLSDFTKEQQSELKGLSFPNGLPNNREEQLQVLRKALASINEIPMEDAGTSRRRAVPYPTNNDMRYGKTTENLRNEISPRTGTMNRAKTEQTGESRPDIQEETTRLRTTNQDMQENIRRLKAENQENILKIQSLTEKITNLERERKNLKKTSSDSSDIPEQTEQCKVLEADLTRTTEEKTMLEQENIRILEKLKALQETNALLSTKIEKMSQRLEHENRESASKLTEYEQNIASLETRLDELKLLPSDQADQSEKTRTDLELVLEKTQAHNKALTMQIESGGQKLKECTEKNGPDAKLNLVPQFAETILKSQALFGVGFFGGSGMVNLHVNSDGVLASDERKGISQYVFVDKDFEPEKNLPFVVFLDGENNTRYRFGYPDHTFLTDSKSTSKSRLKGRPRRVACPVSLAFKMLSVPLMDTQIEKFPVLAFLAPTFHQMWYLCKKDGQNFKTMLSYLLMNTCGCDHTAIYMLGQQSAKFVVVPLQDVLEQVETSKLYEGIQASQIVGLDLPSIAVEESLFVNEMKYPSLLDWCLRVWGGPYADTTKLQELYTTSEEAKTSLDQLNLSEETKENLLKSSLSSEPKILEPLFEKTSKQRVEDNTRQITNQLVNPIPLINYVYKYFVNLNDSSAETSQQNSAIKSLLKMWKAKDRAMLASDWESLIQTNAQNLSVIRATLKKHEPRHENTTNVVTLQSGTLSDLLADLARNRVVALQTTSLSADERTDFGIPESIESTNEVTFPFMNTSRKYVYFVKYSENYELLMSTDETPEHYSFREESIVVEPRIESTASEETPPNAPESSSGGVSEDKPSSTQEFKYSRDAFKNALQNADKQMQDNKVSGPFINTVVDSVLANNESFSEEDKQLLTTLVKDLVSRLNTSKITNEYRQLQKDKPGVKEREKIKTFIEDDLNKVSGRGPFNTRELEALTKIDEYVKNKIVRAILDQIGPHLREFEVVARAVTDGTPETPTTFGTFTQESKDGARDAFLWERYLRDRGEEDDDISKFMAWIEQPTPIQVSSFSIKEEKSLLLHEQITTRYVLAGKHMFVFHTTTTRDVTFAHVGGDSYDALNEYQKGVLNYFFYRKEEGFLRDVRDYYLDSRERAYSEDAIRRAILVRKLFQIVSYVVGNSKLLEDLKQPIVRMVYEILRQDVTNFPGTNDKLLLRLTRFYQSNANNMNTTSVRALLKEELQEVLEEIPEDDTVDDTELAFAYWLAYKAIPGSDRLVRKLPDVIKDAAKIVHEQQDAFTTNTLRLEGTTYQDVAFAPFSKSGPRAKELEGLLEVLIPPEENAEVNISEVRAYLDNYLDNKKNVISQPATSDLASIFAA